MRLQRAKCDWLPGENMTGDPKDLIKKERNQFKETVMAVMATPMRETWSRKLKLTILNPQF